MKKSRISKTRLNIATVFLTVLMSFGSMNVFAATTVTSGTIYTYLNSNNTNTSITAYFNVSSNPADPLYTANNWECYQVGNNYYYLDTTNKSIVENAISASNTASANNEKAYENYSAISSNIGIDSTAGIQTATTILSGFSWIISLAVGILIVLISLGMTLYSAFDVVYILFPTFRANCDSMKQSGGTSGFGASVMTKQSKGETKLRFVTDEAQYAVVAADTVQSGKNALIIYFGKRWVSYVALAVLLFILFTGNIQIFSNLALKAVSGIIKILQSM